jgi:MFS family permease
MSHLLTRILPYSSIRNVAIFYFQSACVGSFFCAAIWLFVWQRYLSLGEVGLVDWLAVIVAWFAEVPSGVLADKLGRKWLVIMALVLSAAGIVMQGLSHTFTAFLLSNILYMVGFSFHSGAAEALVYESLPSDNQLGGATREHAYERVVAASNFIQLITHVVSILLGTFAYNVMGDAAPFLLQGGFYAIGALVGLWAIESVPEDKRVYRTSIRQTIIDSVKSVKFITRELFPVAIITFAALGLYDMCAWSFMRTAIATKFGFNHEGYAIIINLGIIGAAICVRLLPKIRAMLGDLCGFPGVGIFLGVLFLLCAFNLGSAGAVALALIIMIGNLLKPWSLVIVNKNISDDHRATVISLFSFITRAQFLLLGALVPYLAQRGYLDVSLFWLGTFAVVASIGAWMMGRNKVAI